MLFDAYLMVDWSAAARPRHGKDSIWIALEVRGDRETREPENPRTRHAAAARVRGWLRSLTDRGLRVLVGFDFPYGYPRGLASALEERDTAAPWRATWDRLAEAICDDDHNGNDRFEVAARLNARLGPGAGPFWGCPAGRQTGTLRSTRDFAFPYDAAGRRLERLRAAERRLRGVQETWKLSGAGCVGGQALVGIPRLARLRDDPTLAAISRVWPFETGFTSAPSPARAPCVLHAEIWPGIVRADARPGEARDAAQVRTLAHHFARLDERGALGALFDVPRSLGADERAACVAEEGWILGAGAA